MSKRVSIEELYAELRRINVYLTIYHKDSNEAKQLRKHIRALRSRIANRERYDAMRSMGMTKTPYGWE